MSVISSDDASSSSAASLVAELNKVGQGPLNEHDRVKALDAAKRLVTELETPQEVILRFCFEFGPQRSALRVGCDLRIFRILTTRNGIPISSEDLAAETGAQPLLIAMGFAREASEQSYVANRYTEAMAEPSLEGGIKISHDMTQVVLDRIPEYLRQTNFTLPTGGKDCAFQYTHKTTKSYFEYVHADPELSKNFNVFMSGIRNVRKYWTDWYPIDAKILTGFSGAKDDVLVVDVGGGTGHDSTKFLAKYPQSHGHLVLQDLPEVLAQAESLDQQGIRLMAHNFFELQPIKGARAYYLHFVFHDWPDDKCREILENIKPAMTPGYSMIILNDSVLPNTGCSSFHAGIDWDMMAVLAGMERSGRQWIELVESAGLEVVDIQVSPFSGDSEGVVMAMLPS